MKKFELLCVTMNQKDFSKIREMNIKSNVVFANQCNETSYKEIENDGKIAKMISTTTRGVGINRNIALQYATADYCLLADDDCFYVDNLEEIVVKEFENNTKADIFIFNLETNSAQRKQVKYNETKKYPRWKNQPWGAFRVAFRLSSIKKANIHFTTLFGGGCLFPSGEDSMWLNDAKKKKLNFYVSKKIIGKVNFDKSSWFTGYDEKFYFAKGAYYKAVHPKTIGLWMLYFAFRTRKFGKMSFKKKFYWMKKGKKGYEELSPFESNNNI